MLTRGMEQGRERVRESNIFGGHYQLQCPVQDTNQDLQRRRYPRQHVLDAEQPCREEDVGEQAGAEGCRGNRETDHGQVLQVPSVRLATALPLSSALSSIQSHQTTTPRPDCSTAESILDGKGSASHSPRSTRLHDGVVTYIGVG